MENGIFVLCFLAFLSAFLCSELPFLNELLDENTSSESTCYLDQCETDDSGIHLKDKQTCGKTDTVLGGKPAPENRYGYMCIFKLYRDDVDYAERCGGTLISSEWVLTAAHCVKRIQNSDTSRKSSRVGCNIPVKFKTADLKSGVIERVEVHPDYDDTTFSNDIALVKLNEAEKEKYDVVDLPIVGYDKNVQTNSSVSVLGAGNTEETEESTLSSDLQVARRLTIRDAKTCDNAAANDAKCKPGDKAFCVGDAEKDTLKGDSGGPLIADLPEHEEDCRLPWLDQVIGVTSCTPQIEHDREGEKFGFYTNISVYIPWIAKTTGICLGPSQPMQVYDPTQGKCISSQAKKSHTSHNSVLKRAIIAMRLNNTDKLEETLADEDRSVVSEKLPKFSSGGKYCTGDKNLLHWSARLDCVDCWKTLTNTSAFDSASIEIAKHAIDDGKRRPVDLIFPHNAHRLLKYLTSPKRNLPNAANQETIDFRDDSLFIAVKRNSINVTIIAIEKSIGDINYDENECTVLHEAAKLKSFDIVKAIIDSGRFTRINDAACDDGHSALMFAAREGDAEIIKYLLKHNANVCSKNTLFHYTALHLAARNGHYEAVEALVDSKLKCDGVELTEMEDKEKNKPIDTCCEEISCCGVDCETRKQLSEKLKIP